MGYPDIYNKSGLSDDRLSKARAIYLLNCVALRHSVSGSVAELSRSLGLHRTALRVAVHRKHMTRHAWSLLEPLMTTDEQQAFLKEIRVPNE